MSNSQIFWQAKTALITGGNSGIGLATARLFVERGGRVVITGRDPGTLEAALGELGKAARAVRVDVGHISDIERAVAEAKSFLGHIDLLFVNAGGATFKSIEEVDEAAYDSMMNGNLKGAFFTVQKALPLLARGASIVVNGSVAGVKGLPQTSVYSATKAGLRSFVRTFAAELAERGIRVNAVAPGPIETPALNRLGLAPEAVTTAIQGLVDQTLLKRIGTAEEIAESVLFLASPQASYITGVELCVDGGLAQV